MARVKDRMRGITGSRYVEPEHSRTVGGEIRRHILEKQNEPLKSNFEELSQKTFSEIKNKVITMVAMQGLKVLKRNLRDNLLENTEIGFNDALNIMNNMNPKLYGIKPMDMQPTLKLISENHSTASALLITQKLGYYSFKYNDKVFILHLSRDRNDFGIEPSLLVPISSKKEQFNLVRFLQTFHETTEISVYNTTFNLKNNEWSSKSSCAESRSLDTIYLKKSIKEELVNSITNFNKEESWYKEKNIPYKFNILLHGKPGTGKTSIIRALASKFDKRIDFIKSEPSKDNLNYLEIEQNNITVFEDIDTCDVVQKRDDNVKNNNLSAFLNLLDGFNSAKSSLIILTTNHLEKLDPAIYRAGRIDLIIEIPEACNDVLYQFVESFFPNELSKLEGFNIKENITVSQFQEYVIKKFTLEQILEEVRK